MKKNILLLISALFCTPCTFATVVFTASGDSNGRLILNYNCTAGEVIRGVALNISVQDAELTDVYNVKLSPVFNAYVDYYYTYPEFLNNLSETDLTGQRAHPVAHPSQPGVYEDVPFSYFTISVGVLDTTGQQLGAPPSGLFGTIQFGNYQDEDYCVTITENSLRGGIVGDNINDIILPETTCITIPEPATLSLLGLGFLSIRKRRNKA